MDSATRLGLEQVRDLAADLAEDRTYGESHDEREGSQTGQPYPQ